MNIRTIIEGERGCGFRKAGGLYLVGGASGSACCKLPFPLTVCPCCGGGIKFGRGFGWINTDLFQDGQPCSLPGTCIAVKPGERIGLMWVGHKFYTPTQFANEARTLGISKRIAQMPRGLKVGETWIALAHKKAISSYVSDPTARPGQTSRMEYQPGIFMIFKLTGIQYVVHDSDGDDYLESLEKRGIELVRVEKAEQLQIKID